MCIRISEELGIEQFEGIGYWHWEMEEVGHSSRKSMDDKEDTRIFLSKNK